MHAHIYTASNHPRLFILRVKQSIQMSHFAPYNGKQKSFVRYIYGYPVNNDHRIDIDNTSIRRE